MRYRTVVEKNKIIIIDRNLEKLNGQMVEVIVMPSESPEYWQHKYYRGYLLPAIADAMGERDTSKVHLFLKAKYLMQSVTDVGEIPKSKLRRGIYAANLQDVISMSIPLTTYVTGAVIVSDRDGNLCGYIPSLALVTFEEMKNYIYDCEKWLTEMGGSLKNEAMEVRRKWTEQ